MDEKTFWFIEPLDDTTNRVLAENLSAENAHRDMVCFDGKARNLWECTHLQLARFEDVSESIHLRFRTFVRGGVHGKVRPWLFFKQRRRKPLAKAA